MPIKRIFIDEKSRRTENTAHNRIKIGSVLGLMTSKFSVSLQASWENIISTDGILGGVQKAMGVAGYSIFNAGIWTRKYYKGGAYLSVSPSFRITDWNGTGNVLSNARILLAQTVPKWTGNKNNNELNKHIGTEEHSEMTEKQRVTQKKDNLKELRRIAGSIGSTLSNFSLSKAPSTVTVEISDYFKQSQMIIENVSVEFSEEHGPKGPLFADFSVTLSSIEATTAGSLGLQSSHITRVTTK